MHILFFAQHYAPEQVSGAVLSTELAQGLVNRGHQVSFVTCAPNYPYGNVFHGYQNRLLSIEKQGGVKIIRTWSYLSPKRTLTSRIANYGTFSASAFLGGLYVRKADLIFCYSPPLSLGISAWLISRLKGIPWLFRIEDIYPDAAINTGVLRNPVVVRSLIWLEKALYLKANHISVISENFRRNLLMKGVPEGKISVTPAWADPERICPMAKENSFRQVSKLVGKFIVLYSGNMGYNSALEDVLEAAEQLSGIPDILFIIVGEGVKKKNLEDQARERHLTNILFLPFQPPEVYPCMLAAADLALVTLHPSSGETSLPSKIFSIMASGRPVLSIAAETSEISRLVHDANCGIQIFPGQVDRLVQSIREAYRSPASLDGFGRNSRDYFLDHFTLSDCLIQFEQIMQGLVDGSHSTHCEMPY